jgi:hypothetical protein
VPPSTFVAHLLAQRECEDELGIKVDVRPRTRRDPRSEPNGTLPNVSEGCNASAPPPSEPPDAGLDEGQVGPTSSCEPGVEMVTDARPRPCRLRVAGRGPSGPMPRPCDAVGRPAGLRPTR